MGCVASHKVNMPPEDVVGPVQASSTASRRRSSAAGNTTTARSERSFKSGGRRGSADSSKTHDQVSSLSSRSQRSQTSNRSKGSVRESSTGSSRALNFSAMLEPDPGTSHTLADGAFRDKGVHWIIDQVARKTTAALDVHAAYVGDDTQGDLKLFDGGDVVDAVRCRVAPVPFDVFTQSMWETLTVSVSTTAWHMQALEMVDDVTRYTQVTFPNVIEPGTPLVLNVLLKKTVSPDRVVVALRNIAEDNLFPLPKQTITFSVSGWVVMDREVLNSRRSFVRERETRHATRVRSLFRCRAVKDKVVADADDDDGPKDDAPWDAARAAMSEWIMDAAIHMFHVIEADNIARIERAVAAHELQHAKEANNR
ncbi:Aste57867_18755 [Aphanomyces stellatus]|uniref:Aste57867_18755 protein n=1 Tax=Aphanomyces stellatus TaxID=120398 RepID=A0A485LEY5_9STRA|nr:hypothetical protein As57867_018691 [Aphanomyces stellatus]VFT95489.1 Aste57867_18755 [Aphanomyces stellatus]